MHILLIFFIFLTFYLSYSYSIVSQILTPVSIYEESPISTIVVDLRPTFEKLGVHPDQAVLLHSQPSQPFEYLNGRIRLKSRLDREDYVRKRLCIGGNVLECNFTLTLTVNLNQAPFNYILSQPISCHDINDIIPKFSQTESLISMAENVPIGHRIPLEIAIDLDSPPYGIDHYRLVTYDNHEQYQFSIVYDNQSRELELIVNEKLDREKIEKYIFKLIAIDRGYPPNIGTQILTIEISDINDSRPRFESSVYNISIAENTLPEYLLKLRAIDNDIGSNSELIYTLENDHNGLFRLDKMTGILTLIHALDYEFHTSYQLKVEVHDNGINSLNDRCIINIYVLDQNDHAPSIQMKFNPMFEHNQDGNMAYIPESFDIHLPLAFVNVHDQDSGDYGKAQLTIEPNRLFYLEIIRPNYYSIKSLKHFDRETISTYQIVLHAKDFGQPSLRRSMTFELNITDINDQKPLFQTNYTFNLIENNPIPTVIGQINAYDADQGINGQIKYSIIPSSSSEFFISSIDGIISTNISFDYELKRQYQFQVRARDSGQPPLESYTTVQVNIINQNEYSPEFEKQIYYFFINENLPNKSETFIGKVKANDRDYGDYVYYSLDNNEQFFTIDQNGKIWTEIIFDREIQDQYNLTIFATDNSTAGLIGSTFVIIKITDMNDNYPIFLWPDSDEIRHILSGDHSQRIDPANPLSQFLTDIVVRDDDIGNNSLIQLIISNNDLFYIGSNNSLWLRNSSILPGTYDIEIEARNFDLITKKIFHILIYDRSPFKLNLFNNMRQTFSKLSLLTIIILSFLATGSTILILIYYLYIRIHYPENVQKHFYGSRLIVNDDEKSKENSPQTKMNILSTNHDYAVIVKQRKNSQIPSGNSSSTTDGDFSSSLLSCPLNGISSSTTDLHSSSQKHPPSSTVSALTTLTRKSTRRQQTKNVSFKPTLINPINNLFDDLFQTNSSCYHQNTPSTFSTLPKQTKHDLLSSNQPILTDLPRNDFPTLQTVLNQSSKDHQTKFPQPPPLLNGILLLDQMLTNSTGSNDQRPQTSSTTSNSGWYNVTSNYQTRASIV